MQAQGSNSGKVHGIVAGMTTHPSRPRDVGAQRLGDIAAGPLADIFARQGFASREILARWPEIVGQTLAGHCRPLRLSWPRKRPEPGEQGEAATLELRVESAFALEAQQNAPLILARINAFLGWQAAGRIVLRQGPVAVQHGAPGAATRQARSPSSLPPPSDKVRAAAAGVQDQALRTALERLGAAATGKRE